MEFKHYKKVLSGTYLETYLETVKVSWISSILLRALGEQCLSSNFYCKEHIKQLFTKHNILTVQNLFKYTAINELAKLICLKNPSILFEKLCLSKRNNQNVIILRNYKLGNCFHNSFLTAFNCWNILVSKLKIPSPHTMVLFPNYILHLPNYIVHLPNYILHLPNYIVHLPNYILHLPNYILHLPNYILHLPNYILHLPNYILHLPNYILHLPNYILHLPNYILHLPNYILHLPNYILHLPNYILHLPNYILHLPNYILHLPNYILHLPNDFATNFI